MAKIECVNLEERFGKTYVVSWEADGVTKPQWPKEDHPWLMEIRGLRGTVYPWGGTKLAVVFYDSPKLATKVKRAPYCEKLLDGEEPIAMFDVKYARKVFTLIKAQRRRKITPEQRQELADRAAVGRAVKLANKNT